MVTAVHCPDLRCRQEDEPIKPKERRERGPMHAVCSAWGDRRPVDSLEGKSLPRDRVRGTAVRGCGVGGGGGIRVSLEKKKLAIVAESQK